jgi:hypothetical protein
MVDCSYIFKSSHRRYWVARCFFVVSALGLIGRTKVSCIASHNFRGNDWPGDESIVFLHFHVDWLCKSVLQPTI